MTQEKIFQILETKKYPLKNFWEYLSHYLISLVFFLFYCFFIYKYIDSEEIIFITFFATPCLLCSLFIFFYLGPKQLRIIHINIQFPNNEIAYLKVKEVLYFYKWKIKEENGTNYIQALRNVGFPLDKTYNRAISLFFKNGSIYGISLIYPKTRSALGGFHK